MEIKVRFNHTEEFTNYYHFLVEFCVPLYKITKNQCKKVFMLYENEKDRIIRDKFEEIFDFKLIQVNKIIYDVLKNPEHIIDGLTVTNIEYNYDDIKEFKEYIVQRFNIKKIKDRDIFIKRKPIRRAIKNIDEIQQKLTEYEFIELENLSFRDQVELFYNAKNVIGMHGAGLANLIFAENFNLMEIIPQESIEFESKFDANFYYNLGNKLGKAERMVVESNFPTINTAQINSLVFL